MVVFWGWNSKRHPINLFNAGCHVCQRMTSHVRILQKTAFTLYFIPFIPVRSKKLVICGSCGTEKPDIPQLDQMPIGATWGAPGAGSPPMGPPPVGPPAGPPTATIRPPPR